MHKQKVGVVKITFFPKWLRWGLWSLWPQNRLLWGRGSERPAVHNQLKLTQVNPPPPRGCWSHKKVWLFLACLPGLPSQPHMLGRGVTDLNRYMHFMALTRHSQHPHNTHPSHISMNKLFYLNWFLIMCLKFLLWKCIWYSQQQMEFRMHQLNKWTTIWSKFKKERDENWTVLRKRPGEKFLGL